MEMGVEVVVVVYMGRDSASGVFCVHGQPDPQPCPPAPASHIWQGEDNLASHVVTMSPLVRNKQ